MTGKKDNIFADYKAQVGRFEFDDKVVAVFDDMIRRSVPGYATVIAMTAVLAEKYAVSGTNCYDLGCSLGASTIALRHGIKADNCRIIAVDNSAAMIERCRDILAGDINPVPVELICGDIADIKIENASIVVMNYVLQFFDPARRDELVSKIYNGLRPGGVFILSEKMKFEDEAEQEYQHGLYHEFKAYNGYSQTEISQKRKALENVLIPETLAQHKARIQKAGFASCYKWFQCFNFGSMIAKK